MSQFVTRSRLPLAFPALALSLSCRALLCQSPAPAQSPGTPQSPVIRSTTTVVLVPALITTKAGEPVFTLNSADFTVTDDGVAQKLTLEPDSGGEPLALVVLIQTGGAGAGEIGKFRALSPMIEAIPGDVPHQIAVVAFGSTPKLLQNFTPDPAPLEAAIHNLTPGDSGAAILDAIAYAVSLLQDQPPQFRRAILLFSETLDHGSQTTLDDALRVIGDTNTAIYGLGFSTVKGEAGRRSAHAFADSTPGPTHGCMANPSKTTGPETNSQTDPEQGNAASAPVPKRSAGQIANQAFDCAGLLAPPLALAKMAVLAGVSGLRRNVPETLADLTGGEYFPFKDAHSIERDLMTISNHVPNRYMLSFHPQSPHPGMHTIGLRLPAYPNLDVNARTSYWAEEPKSAP
jgi:VWFA-related protein